MTTIFPSTVICKNCGTPVLVKQIMSTNEFGSPDLDLRPAPMRRSLVYHLIQHCPECGYTGKDITKKPPQTQEFHDFLKNKLASCDKLSVEKLYELAAQIELLYLIPGYKIVAEMFLKAAWIADDKGDKDFAQKMRKASLDYQLKLDDRAPDRILQMIDIARRSEEFEKALELIQNFPESERKDIYEKILIFQEKLVNNKDTGCYLIEDACK